MEDATHALAYGLTEKGLFRAAAAYYGLAKFQDCHETLELLLQKCPHNEIAKTEFTRVQERLKEQSCGQYTFKSICTAAKESPPFLDNATYSSPVEIKASKGRGKGLFATRAIQAGELLLCEKAFSHCYADTSDGSASDISMLMDSETNCITIGTQGHLITAVIHQLQRNPSQMPAFLSLHHGPYEPMGPTEVDNRPIIDTCVPPKRNIQHKLTMLMP